MKQALIKLHISVFMAGFTGVLGKLIQLNVWKLMGIGTIIALHWVCFYGSIKIANVSIGLVCFASVGLFTALLEPLMTDKPFSWPETALGLISLLGIYLIFHFDSRYRTGILLGVASAILGALFSVLNKKYVDVAPPQTLMLYELSGGLLLLTLLMPLYLQYFPADHIMPSLSDWGWLLMLSWLCTVLAMDLMLQALQKISAFTQNLTLNLEPVYGIFLAFILFHENEKLANSFFIGFGLIALSVVLQMLRVVKRKRI
jgi:drug/metabolite transporter (DMT)-like permease